MVPGPLQIAPELTANSEYMFLDASWKVSRRSYGYFERYDDSAEYPPLPHLLRAQPPAFAALLSAPHRPPSVVPPLGFHLAPSWPPGGLAWAQTGNRRS